MKSLNNIWRSFKRNWESTVWGTLVGAIVGMIVFVWQVKWQENRDRIALTKHWASAVTHEIDVNNAQKTDSPYFKKDGDGTYYRRYLSNSALKTFLDLESELKLSFDSTGNYCRSLYELSIAVNQVIDQRNTLKTTATAISLGSILPDLNRAVDSLCAQYLSLAVRTKVILNSEVTIL